MNTEQAKGVAILALAAHAKRESNRDYIDEGKGVAVALHVTGFVGTGRGKRSVSFDVAGDLNCGVTNPTGATTSPAMVDLVAHLVDLIPKTRLAKIADHLQSVTGEDGKLTKPSKEQLSLATSIIEPLKKKKPRAGSIRFTQKGS